MYLNKLMLIVNAGSILLILWQDSANIIYQKHRPAVLWLNKPGMFIVDIYNNRIKYQQLVVVH